MKTILIIVVLSLLSLLATAEKCPQLEVQAGFDLKQYLGAWFEIARLPMLFEANGVCVKANYTLNSTRPGHVVVTNSERIDTPSGEFRIAYGDATIPDPSQPAKFAVRFPGAPIVAPYWVLSTDYQTFAVVYSCTDILGFYKVQFAWILSRKPTLDAAVLKKAQDLLTSAKVPIDKMIMTRQEGCW